MVEPRLPLEAQPSISVVVCCFTADRWPLTLAALESVRRQSRPAAQVVLVVDHCEALYDRARAELTDVTVVANDGVQGLSGSRNSGVAASHGDVVAFLDDDAQADQAWLATLARLYARPYVLGVGGVVDPVWDDGRPRWIPAEFEWVVGCSPAGLPRVVAPVRNFIGANMSFRRSTLRAVGGFRTGLGRVGSRPVGCEETELCLRVWACCPSGRLLHQPAARVTHHVPGERGTWRYFRQRCWAEGLSKAVVARHAGAGAALSSERHYVASVLPRGLRDALVAGQLARAGALVVGTGLAALGFVAGRLTRAGGGPAEADATRDERREEVSP